MGLLLLAVLAACGGSDSDSDNGSGGGGGGGGDGKLTIGGWGGVLDDATTKFYVDPFQEAGGVGATFDDAPGTQLARVEAQHKVNKIEWDAIDSVAGDAAFAMEQKGYLAPLPADLKSELEDALGADRVTDFGFSHGTVANVIVCNMDKMDTCPKDMQEFYDTDKFPQNRMFGGVGPAMALTTAQTGAGMPPKETADTPVDLDGVFDTLDQLKPKIKVFWQSGDQQEQVMRSGAVDMGIMWNNRAARLAESGMNIKVVWVGGVYEASYWTVLKGAPHEQQAFDLLKFIATHPDEQAEWAKAVGGSSIPNPEGIKLLPPETAKGLADAPENFDVLATPNFAWFAEHDKEVNSRFQDFVRG